MEVEIFLQGEGLGHNQLGFCAHGELGWTMGAQEDFRIAMDQ